MLRIIDPANMSARYNFACGLATYLKDADAAMAILGLVRKKTSARLLKHAQVDPAFEQVRADPRFKAMIQETEARLAREKVQ